MKLHRLEDGLTLIELLVSMAIISFIISVLFAFYWSGMQSWKRSIDQIEYQQSARIAMDKMIRELLYASEVSLNQEKTEIHFKVPGEWRTLCFRLEGYNLVKCSITDSHYHNTVALGITKLLFDIDNNNTVSINLEAGFNSSALSLTGRVKPRNLP